MSDLSASEAAGIGVLPLSKTPSISNMIPNRGLLGV